MSKLSTITPLIALMAMASVGFVATGCESLDINETEEAAGAEASAAEGTETAAASADGEAPTGTASGSGDWSPANSSWYGPNFSGSTREPAAVMHSADVDLGANVVRISYDPLPGGWPKQVNAPGMLCLFTKQSDGSWLGGKFEWLDPGQTTKSLENIDHGYNGWSRPATGAETAVVIFSTDGAYPSNPGYPVYD